MIWVLGAFFAAAYGTIIPLLITVIPFLILASLAVLSSLAGVLLMIIRVTVWLGTGRDSKSVKCAQIECTLEGLAEDGALAHAWTDFSAISLSDDGALLCLMGTGSARPRVIWLPFAQLVNGTPEHARTWFRENGLASEGQDSRFWHIRAAAAAPRSKEATQP